MKQDRWKKFWLGKGLRTLILSTWVDLISLELRFSIKQLIWDTMVKISFMENSRTWDILILPWMLSWLGEKMIHRLRMTLRLINMHLLTKEKLISLELISFRRHRISTEPMTTNPSMSKLFDIHKVKTKKSLRIKSWKTLKKWKPWKIQQQNIDKQMIKD